MKRINFILLQFLCVSISFTSWSIDGEPLFKAKCNACHMVDKNSTGPLLKGVKQKWINAGEGELIYEWIKNSETLIATGKSQMANAIKDYSPTAMSAQTVTKEEADAILDYIDNYVAAPAAGTTADTGTSTVPTITKILVPNYVRNLTLFYWLLASIIVLLIGIVVLSGSITTLVKSNYFKNRISEKNNRLSDNISVKSIVLILGIFGLLAANNSTFALTFNGPGEAEKGAPWLLIEDVDLYFMVAINLLLLGILLYLRRMFRDFLRMVQTPKATPEPIISRTKINTILTDAVAIEEEHTILMQHEYDGIRELDNNLPPWWVWGFYATIVFAVIYLFNYHVIKTGDLQAIAYNKEIARANKEVSEYLSTMAMNVDETNATLLTEASDLSAGKALFEANCVVCHNPNGEGNIGPNLTDDHWIYGPDIKDLFKTIKLGTPNGMPEHASKMNPVQLQQVASFLLSLPYTKGKEPEGTKLSDKATAVK